MKRGRFNYQVFKIPLPFLQNPSAGTEYLDRPTRIWYALQKLRVKEWVFCTSVQSCPLQHPAWVAMVTCCNLAFAHRQQHNSLTSGPGALFKCINCPLPSLLVRCPRTRDMLVPFIPSGPIFQREARINLSFTGGAKLGRKGEESKFTEGRLKDRCS